MVRQITYGIKPCIKCGEEYRPTSATQQWCQSCLTKLCGSCGSAFSVGKRSRYNTARFCSTRCRGRYRSEQLGELAPNWRGGRSLTSRTCEQCGTAFKSLSKLTRK